MSKEIERKFLVNGTSYKNLATASESIEQAYLSTLPETTVRVRIRGDKAFITVKSKNIGITRNEWEYEIPVNEARQMLENCAVSPILSKTRYTVGRWEVDEFAGCLQGLTVAEIELVDESETVLFPDFIGKEVSDDVRYYNSALAVSGKIPD